MLQKRAHQGVQEREELTHLPTHLLSIPNSHEIICTLGFQSFDVERSEIEENMMSIVSFYAPDTILIRRIERGELWRGKSSSKASKTTSACA